MHQSANQFSFTHHRAEVDAVPGTHTPEPRPRLVVITQPLPCSSTATMLVVPACLAGARSRRSTRPPSVHQLSDPSTHRRHPLHGAEQIIKIITAGMQVEVVHPNRSRGRLDHVVGVEVFPGSTAPPSGDRDDQRRAYGTVIERPVDPAA